MASTVTIPDYDATVLSDEAILEQITDAITGIMTTGQSYTVFGSRVVTRSNMGDLQKMKSLYEQRILRKKGWTGKNLLDHSGSDFEEVPE